MTSVREGLIHSGVGTISVAVLLFWSFELAFHALWGPFWRLVDFGVLAVATRGIPYIPHGFTVTDQIVALNALLYSIESLASFVLALIYSRFLFASGPFHALRMSCVSTWVK